MYDSLLEYDENLQIRGNLAKKYTISNEGRTITFELHQNVRFHDGTPMTAKDVVHSHSIIMDPRTPTSYASNYEKVSSIKAIDEYTVEVSYTEVYAPALSSWVSFIVIPSHLVKSAHKIASHPLNRAPIGTGMYKFATWKPGTELTLVANDDYFKGRPNIDGYRYRIIPDQQTMFLELLTGGLDQMGLTPIQWNRNSKQAKFEDNMNKYQWNSFGYTYFGFNLARPKFADKRVRHALAHAINRKEIVEGVIAKLGHAVRRLVSQ